MASVPDLSRNALFGLDGKVAVVTGGGTGLGLMMSTAFVQNGVERIYICSRKLKNLEAAANTLNAIRPGVCIPLEADLTTGAGCKALASTLSSRERKIHILVNNSGVSWAQPMEGFEEKRGWDRVFDVNVKSVFYLSVALLPLLEAQTTVDAPATIINISSVYATLPMPNMPSAPPNTGAWSYLASKAAVSHLTRNLATKLKPRNVNVNAIAPGFFPSNMTAHGASNLYDQSHPAGRQGTPQDIAGPALLLAGRGGAHLSGIILTTDGGMSNARIDSLPREIAQRYLPTGWPLPAAKDSKQQPSLKL